MTWIEVTDTAVKVGLGAAITAVASVALVFAGFIKEILSDRRNRRLKHIEEALTGAEKYMNYMIRHASTCAWYYATNAGVDEEAKLKIDYDRSATQWDDMLDHLNTATSRLMLYGYTEAAETLRSTSEIADEKLRTIESSGTMAEQDMKFREFKAAVGKKRKELLKQLGIAYHAEREIELVIGPVL